MSIELDKLPLGFKRIWREEDPMVGDFLLIETEEGLVIRIEALNLTNHECSINILPFKSENYYMGLDEERIGAVYCSANRPVEFWSSPDKG